MSKKITSHHSLAGILCAVGFLICGFAASVSAATINVDRTDDTGAAAACTAAANDCSLRGAFAFANANSGTVINIPAGTYNLTIVELQVGTATNISTTITGAGAGVTTINQTVADQRVIDLNPTLAANVVVNISGVRITGGNSPSDSFGGGGLIGGGAGNTLNLSNSIFENNSDINAATAKGGAIEWAGGGFLNIDNCTFNNNTAGSAAGNKGVGGGVQFQLLNLAGASGQGGLTIINSTFTNNKAGASNSGAGGGLSVTVTTTQTPRTVTVTNNTFTGNQANAATNGLGGAITNASSSAITVKFNRITGNTATGGATGIYETTGALGTIDATDNWWGCSAGPGNTGCDSIGGVVANITTNPRIVLTHTPTTTPIVVGQTTVLTASFLRDSANNVLTTANISRLIGLPITFNGAVSGTLSGAQTTIQTSGTATATFTANSAGAGSANAIVDNQTTTASITVNKANTAITMNSDTPDPTVTGQSYTVTFNAPTVTAPGAGTPTGTVTVSDGSNTCTATLPTLNCTLTGTTAGAKNLTATYNGDTNFNASAASASIPHLVNQASTTTAITSDVPDPSSVGQNVVVTFTVTANAPGAGTATGNVTVSDGVNSCIGTVAAGQCTVALATLGSRTLTATYAGDTNFTGSVSAGAAHQVCGTGIVVTNTTDSGAGSLRQAIVDVCPGGTITFSALFNTPQTITLTSGELAIDKSLTITGTGASQLTVSGNNASRVFNIGSVTPAVNVSISALTIANGRVSVAAGVAFGGGIFNNSTGTLAITLSKLTNNQAITTTASSSLTEGGAIFNNASGIVNVTDTTLSGNSTTGGSTSGESGGAAICNFQNGTLNILRGTISGNTSSASGNFAAGAIYNNGNGAVNITNSTISGNTSTGNGVLAAGGGLTNLAGVVTLVNDTIVNNSSLGNVSRAGGGVFNNNTAAVNVKNTIIALNTALSGGRDYQGSLLVSQGFNLIGSNDGIAAPVTQPTDQIGTEAALLDPLISPLANNGGLTQTHALLSGSPASDKGGAAAGVTTDQRGSTRPVDNPLIPNATGGDGSDIGAFEVQLAPTAAMVSIGGRILTPDGRGLRNATVILTDSGGNTRTARSTTFGYYRFNDIAAGQTVIITIVSKRYRFAPQVVSVTEDIEELNFYGTVTMNLFLTKHRAIKLLIEDDTRTGATDD